MLCLTTKANTINAAKSREVLLKARRVKAVTPAGNEHDDKSSRKGAAMNCFVQDSLSQNQGWLHSLVCCSLEVKKCDEL